MDDLIQYLEDMIAKNKVWERECDERRIGNDDYNSYMYYGKWTAYQDVLDRIKR